MPRPVGNPPRRGATQGAPVPVARTGWGEGVQIPQVSVELLQGLLPELSAGVTWLLSCGRLSRFARGARGKRETCRKLVTRREVLVVACAKVVAGDGEPWLNSGNNLKSKPT